MTSTPFRPTAAIFIAFASASAGWTAEIVPLAGKPIRGTITGVDAQFVTFKDEADAELKLPLKEMSAVELGPKIPTLADKVYDEIELTDGTLFRAAPGAAKFKLKKLEPGTLPGPEGADAPTVDVPLDVTPEQVHAALVSGSDKLAQFLRDHLPRVGA